MITASIDRPKLQRSLRRFAKDFGESNAQALVRWGVQTCRELAGSTQVFGKGAKAKRQQWNSIEAGARTVINIAPRSKKRQARVLTSVEDVSAWIDANQGSRGRTRSVPVNERPFVTQSLFDKTIRERRKLAGMAKGGWLGAGQSIARAQRGQDRINIGKNFLGYAQIHSRFGASRKPVPGWKPRAEITNRARHVSTSYVLSLGRAKRSVDWGLKKTVQWYRSALRRQNQKQRP